MNKIVLIMFVIFASFGFAQIERIEYPDGTYMNLSDENLVIGHKTERKHTLYCDENDLVITGGCYFRRLYANYEHVLVSSFPLKDRSGWSCVWKSTQDYEFVNARVICKPVPNNKAKHR